MTALKALLDVLNLIGYQNWWSHGHPNTLGQMNRGILVSCGNHYCTGTVHLEMDFKSPRFLRQIIYSRYRVDEENAHIQKNGSIYVLLWMSYVLLVEAAFLD